MKKTIVILILFIFFQNFGYSQIIGQLFENGIEYPAAEISIVGIKGCVKTDFDGNFEIQIPNEKKTFDILIDLNLWYEKPYKESKFKELKILITNIELNELSQLNLNKIELPTYKSISIEEFDKLELNEKRECRVSAHYANILGYENSRELASENIMLNCKSNNGISEFTFDKDEKLITVSWNNIKDCE